MGPFRPPREAADNRRSARVTQEPTKVTVDSDGEEATELGVVWKPYIIKETECPVQETYETGEERDARIDREEMARPGNGCKLSLAMVDAYADMGAHLVRLALPSAKSSNVPASSGQLASPSLSEFENFLDEREANIQTQTIKQVVILNKGAAKGMKGIIKSKLLVTHYKNLVTEKLREHIISCRVVPSAMFHAAPKTINLVTSDINFLSVGEWVKVDANRTIGFNSDGGICCTSRQCKMRKRMWSLIRAAVSTLLGKMDVLF